MDNPDQNSTCPEMERLLPGEIRDSPEGILLLSREGLIEFANEAAGHLLGEGDYGGHLGKGWLDLCPPAYRGLASEAFTRAGALT